MQKDKNAKLEDIVPSAKYLKRTIPVPKLEVIKLVVSE